MRLADIVDREIADIFAEEGIDELYDTQVSPLMAVQSGKSVVVAYPTASGKSLIAYAGALRSVLNGKKALYMVPLRALASEKYEDLMSFRKIGVRVGISTGDYDRRDERLGRNDIIIATSEKIDSLIRHKAGWMSEIGTIIADEVHLINDASRGPTMEVTLSKLRKLNPESQVIALSATISNSDDIAEWLNAEHFRSEWRPVSLRKGIYYDRSISFTDGEERGLGRAGVEGIVSDALKRGGQALVFVSTRRYTESQAEKLIDIARSHLGPLDTSEIADLGDDRTADRLLKCLKGRVAFHHAGLSSLQRKTVESLFKERKIAVIVATPTLAAGINLPAKTVVVRDTKRYDISGYGWMDLPVMEVEQMLGRAGRPKYDKEGEGVIVAKTKEDVERIQERYLEGDSEPVRSALGSEESLRTHTLALISTFGISSEDELYEFYSSTFYGKQNDVRSLERSIWRVLQFLFDNDLIEMGSGELRPTDFGIRTSETYIDPMSAVIIRKALESPDEISDFGYLHTIGLTPDMYTLYPKKKEEKTVYGLIESDGYETPISPYDVREALYVGAFKVALVLNDWIDEVPEKRITEDWSIYPGDLASRVELAEWLITSARELSRLFRPEDTHRLSVLGERIHHGVRPDVLNMMKLEGIGRTRGRALYRAGFRSISELARASEDELMAVPGIGEALAKRIKKQVGGNTYRAYWEV